MLDGCPESETRELHEVFSQLTMRIAAKAFFSVELSNEAHALARAFTAAAEVIALRLRRPFSIPDLIPTQSNRRYLSAVRRLDRLVYRIIAERRLVVSSPRPDLLQALVEARDGQGQPLSDAQLRDEITTILLAGYETTALGLVWITYLLARHPRVAEPVAAEYHDRLGNRPPTLADLAGLHYVRAVVQEGLRLYPPAYAIGREARHDTLVGGQRVPRGATVFMSPWLVHRDPRHFDAPDDFVPERWPGGMPKALPRFAYFPFRGRGLRTCAASLMRSAARGSETIQWAVGAQAPKHSP